MAPLPVNSSYFFSVQYSENSANAVSLAVVALYATQDILPRWCWLGIWWDSGCSEPWVGIWEFATICGICGLFSISVGFRYEINSLEDLSVIPQAEVGAYFKIKRVSSPYTIPKISFSLIAISTLVWQWFGIISQPGPLPPKAGDIRIRDRLWVHQAKRNVK
jgi:hypothetical protein